MRDDLRSRLAQFKAQYPVDPAVQDRVTKPPVEFIGDEILELAVSALLQGENVLLCGGKATGKNILADNLAWLFGRPSYNVSFHVNTDSSTLIGTDTFTAGEVRLRNGPVAQAAQCGGFCILDEINMAKNDAVAVLHSVLDYRRLIDVPGYATIIVLILFLGGMQLFCIGLIGEYVGRIFEQSKHRPVYLAKEVLDYRK